MIRGNSAYLNLTIACYSERAMAISIGSESARAGGGTYGEMLLWCCYANRQMVTLGITSEATHAILRGLDHAVANLFTTMEAALRVTRGRESDPAPQLVPRQGRDAARRFTATLQTANDVVHFTLSPRGFRLHRARSTHFASVSVARLLQYLLLRRAGDVDFGARLLNAANMIKNACAMGALNANEQVRLAFLITQTAFYAPDTHLRPDGTFARPTPDDMRYEPLQGLLGA